AADQRGRPGEVVLESLLLPALPRLVDGPPGHGPGLAGVLGQGVAAEQGEEQADREELCLHRRTLGEGAGRHSPPARGGARHPLLGRARENLTARTGRRLDRRLLQGTPGAFAAAGSMRFSAAAAASRTFGSASFNCGRTTGKADFAGGPISPRAPSAG